jgi:hypothetical protein
MPGTFFYDGCRQESHSFLTLGSRWLIPDGLRHEYIFLTVFRMFPTVHGRQEFPVWGSATPCFNIFCHTPYFQTEVADP